MALFLGIKRPGREADHSLRLGPNLGVNGALSPLTLRVFLACLEKTLPLPYVNRGRCSRGVAVSALSLVVLTGFIVASFSLSRSLLL